MKKKRRTRQDRKKSLTRRSKRRELKPVMVAAEPPKSDFCDRDPQWLVERKEYEATKNPVYVWEALADLLNPPPDEFYPATNLWRRHPSRDDVPIPLWIREYLARVALAIARLSRPQVITEVVDDDATRTRRFVDREVPIPRKNDIQQAVAKAFEFTRRGRWNPFVQITSTAHEIGIAFKVYQKRHLDGLSEDAAIREVAASHPAQCEDRCQTISVSTVRSHWKRHFAGVLPLKNSPPKKK